MKDDDRYEIRLSGAGGQGIITAAFLLAESVALDDRKYVCQTQSYGPEARGGKSKAEIVISNRPIDYPKVIKVDLLLAMNQNACDAYSCDFKPNGLLLVDADLVDQIPTSRAVAIPFTAIAQKITGGELSANMVALGAIAHICPMVDSRNLEKVIAAKVPKGTTTANRKAFLAGIKAARDTNLSLLPRSIVPEEEDEI